MAQEQASVVISAVDQATEVINKVSGQFSGLQGSWGKLVGALGVGATATYLTTIVKDSIEAADRMGELSKITGVSVSTLSSLGLAAKTSGLDIETVASLLGKMNKNLAGVEEPGTSAAKGLGMLGINAEKFKDAKVEDRLFILADALEGVDNSTGDASRALDLLVKGGSALIPMLDGGSEGLREMMATAEALGMTLDESTVASADRVADSFTILTQLGTGLGNKIMREVLPTLEGLTASFLGAAKNSGLLESAAKGVAAVFNVLVTAAVAAMTAFKAAGSVIAGLIAGLQLLVTGDRKGALAAVKMGFDDAGKAVKDSSKFITDLWSNQLPKLTDAEIKTSKAIANRTGETQKGTKATDEASKAAKAFADEQDKLIKKATEYIQTQRLELDGSQKLTEAQKQMLSIGEYMVKNYQNLSDEELEYLRGLLLTIDANDEARRAQDANSASLKAAAEAYVKAHDKAGELVGALEAEVSAMQYTGTEREIQIKLLELEKTGVDKTTAAYVEYEARIREAVGSIQAQKASKEASENSAKEWSKAASSIEQALTDAMVQGFGNSKSIVKSIGDWIVNYFKTTIAQGIAKALTGAIMGGIGSIAQAIGLGGSTAAGAAGGVGSIGNLGSVIGALGGEFGAGLLGSLTGEIGLGTGIELITSGASVAGGVGAIAPYAAAAYGLYRLISGVGTGRDRSPGSQTYGSLTGTGIEASSIYDQFLTNPAGGSAYNTQLQSIVDAARGIVDGLGGSLSDSLRLSLFSSVSPDGLGGVVASRIGANGQTLYDYSQNGPNSTVEQRIAEQLPRFLLASLQEADLPEEFARIFDELSLQTATADQIAAAIAKAGELKSAQERETDQAVIDTAEATQENTIILRDNSAILDRIAAVLDRIEQVAGTGLTETANAARSAGDLVAGAVLALADRPINVSVEMPEVNGGV